MHLPTSFLCFIDNNNCSIFRSEHQMSDNQTFDDQTLILIFVSRMGSMNSICSWVCKQEGPWGHGWACVVMVGRCQLLMAAAWILPATQGLAPVQLYHWPTCPDNLEASLLILMDYKSCLMYIEYLQYAILPVTQVLGPVQLHHRPI